MTIKIAFEVEGKDEWEFEKHLEKAMGDLGFERKRDARDAVERNQFQSDLHEALRRRNLDPQDIAAEVQAERMAKRLSRPSGDWGGL